MNTRLSSLICLLGLGMLAAGEPPAVPEKSSPPKVELRTDEVSVPTHWFGKRPVVEVKINEKGPYRLILDTGAQGSVLDRDLADELKLPAAGEARVASPGGKGAPAKQVRLDRVEVGDAVLSAVPAVAFDRLFPDRGKDVPRGVLSASLFPGFLVTLDYPQSRLVIRRGELPAPDGARVFAYDAKRPLPEIRLSIAGREVDLHLDSGAPGGIMLPLALAERLPLASKPVEVARGKRVDQDVVILGARLNGQVKVGRYVLENPELRFQDIADAPGHVGYEFLRRFAVTLDAANHRIRLVEGTAPDKQEKAVTPDLSKITDEASWKIYNASAEVSLADSKKAARLKAKGDSAQGIVGLALPRGVEFATGAIEIELKGMGAKQRSFLGVAFNVADEKTFEAVYFRPFNFKAEDEFKGRAVQYIAWPEHTWNQLRKDKPGRFEGRISPVPDPDGWFRARIEVGEKQVRVFVNEGKEPCLTVDRLAEGGKGRPVGLFVDTAEGLYNNLRITPTK
jgi:hypothetical protein